jgi:hypothetical protein
MSKPTEQIIQMLKELISKVDSIQTKFSEFELEYRLSRLESKPSYEPKAITSSSATAKKSSATKTVKIATPIKKGNINIDIYNDCLLVTGETFDRKDLIKSLGGKWSGEHKGWTIPIKQLDTTKEKLETYCSNVEYNEHDKNLLNGTINSFVKKPSETRVNEMAFLDDDE